MSFSEPEEVKALPWLRWVLVAHSLIIGAGILTQRWFLLPFCLWTPDGLWQLPGVILWMVLTISPGLGLIALKVPALRWPYISLVITTPVFVIAVLSLNSLEVMMCDAP